MSIAISLGYNCKTPQFLVENALRAKKEHGYKTCPFDLCIAPYEGVVACIREDFRDFLNPGYLAMQTVPQHLLASGHDEELLYNTKYGFVFLHESPGHGNLYKNENWSGGKYHFVTHNWENFHKRYTKRIDNFRSYVESGNHVTFGIGAPTTDLFSIESALKASYPKLQFSLLPIPFDRDHYTSILRYSGYVSQ